MQIAVSGRLPRFEPGVFLFHADAFSQRPFSAAFFPDGSSIFSKKNHKDLSVVLLVLTDQWSGALFHFKKGAGSSACICRPEQDRSGLIFYTREELYEHQRKSVPDLDERIRQQEEALEQVAQEQTM